MGTAGPGRHGAGVVARDPQDVDDPVDKLHRTLRTSAGISSSVLRRTGRPARARGAGHEDRGGRAEGRGSARPAQRSSRRCGRGGRPARSGPMPPGVQKADQARARRSCPMHGRGGPPRDDVPSTSPCRETVRRDRGTPGGALRGAATGVAGRDRICFAPRAGGREARPTGHARFLVSEVRPWRSPGADEVPSAPSRSVGLSGGAGHAGTGALLRLWAARSPARPVPIPSSSRHRGPRSQG